MSWKMIDPTPTPDQSPNPSPASGGGSGRSVGSVGGWKIVEPATEPEIQSTARSVASQVADSLKSSVKETAQGVGAVARDPWSVAESLTHIITSTPAFLSGSLRAIQEGAQTLVAGGDLEDVWDRSVAGFNDYFKKASSVIPPYDPKDKEASEFATKTLMTPYLATRALAEDIAAPLEKENPNLAAALRMAGVAAGFAAQGGMHKVMNPKADTAFPKDLKAENLDTTYAKKLVEDRALMERVQVPGRPLSRLSNVERSLAADREAASASPNPRTQQAADVFSQADPLDVMSPAERSAHVIEGAMDQNTTPISRESLRSRLANEAADSRPEFQSLDRSLSRDRSIQRQAESLGENAGPRTQTPLLPENRPGGKWREEPPGPDTVLPANGKSAPAPIEDRIPSGEVERNGFILSEEEASGIGGIKSSGGGGKASDSKPEMGGILSSLNHLLGERGEISLSGRHLSPDQQAALVSLRRELVKLKSNANRTGRSLSDYLYSMGADPMVVDVLLSKELGQSGDKPTTPSSSVPGAANTYANPKRPVPRTQPGPRETLAAVVEDAQRRLRAQQIKTGTASPTDPNVPIESVVESMSSPPSAGSLGEKLVRTRQGISEAFNSPEVVYRRDPDVGSQIYTTLDRANQRGNEFLWREGEEFSRSVAEIKEGKESDLKVGAALDGKLDRNSLNLTERRAYDFLRSKFDFLLDRYVKVSTTSDAAYRDIVRRANSGESVDKGWLDGLSDSDRFAYNLLKRRVSDYLPHIFDRDSVMQELVAERVILENKLRTSVDPASSAKLQTRLSKVTDSINTMEGGDLILYEQLPTELRMRFFEPRKGKEGYNLSAIRAYRAYLNGIKRKIYDEPAVRQVAELHKSLDPSLRQYNSWYVRRFLGWDKHKLDDLAGAVSSFQWMRTLGLNPRSAVVNLTQRINTIAEAGPRWSAEGQRRAFTEEGKTEFNKTGIAREIPQVLMEGHAPPGMEKVRAMVGYLFNKMELGNRRHAFLTGQAKYASEHSVSVSDPAAVQAGIDLAHKTQFRYGKVGMPKALTHPVGRIGLQFWSYPIKQMELMVDWAKNDPKKLITYLAMAEGGKLALQEFMNVDLSNALGFGVNMGEVIQAIRDVPDEDWRGFFRHLKLSVSGGGGLLPSGPGPTVTGMMKVAEGVGEGRGMRALEKELSPVMFSRAKQVWKAIEGRKGSMYPMFSQDGSLMYYLTGKQLLMRSVGPKSNTESLSYLQWKADELLDQDMKGILRDVTRAVVDGDTEKSNRLINKYGIVPSEESIVNEIMRRELPYEDRRAIRKNKRQIEFEALTQGQEQGQEEGQ